ncbi:hypothetical protein [Streptomyces sp. NPDC101132]|uniref:hypothetical protein n=1 Tax=Streptomyces sp. NPDC101132 TaxID=3366110 RepID=UPI0037FBAB45
MAHAAPSAARRHMGTMSEIHTGTWLGPLLCGLVYGIYAAFMKRDTGPVDAANVFYGILCGVLFAGLMFLLLRYGGNVMREVRAGLWFAFAGISTGYLYSLTGDSIWRTVVIALAVALGVGVGAFYWFYQHEP